MERSPGRGVNAAKVFVVLAALGGSSPVLAQDAGVDAGPRDASPILADASPNPTDAAPRPDTGEPDAGCGDVDGLGECQGDIRRVCQGGALSQIDCRALYGQGFTCRLTGTLMAAECVFEGPDGGHPGSDAGARDAGAPDENEDPEPDGCGCYRPAPADGALLLGGMLWLSPRRRKPRVMA